MSPVLPEGLGFTENTDVRAIVEHAVETVRPLIERHNHEFSVSFPPEPIWLQLIPHA
jgi:hypothetical protein